MCKKVLFAFKASCYLHREITLICPEDLIAGFLFACLLHVAVLRPFRVEER